MTDEKTTPRSPTEPTATLGRRRWIALAFISVAQLMIALDATVTNIALPSAQADLGFSDERRQWVITAYTLAFGGLLLLGGRLADYLRPMRAPVHRRRVLGGTGPRRWRAHQRSAHQRQSARATGENIEMILITGATGNVGAEVASMLVASGHPVRAMTRRPRDVSMPDGVEVVHGDAAEPASLDDAFRGADRAFLMTAQQVGNAPRPTHDINLAEAARCAGVTHAVKLSVYGAGNGDDVIYRWHAEAEAALIDTGIDYTLLRPGRFMSNALHWAPMIRRGDEVHIPFAARPAASINPADIAAIAVAALTTNAHRNRAYQLSGPEVLTPAGELDILGEALGRKLRLIEPSIEEARAGLLASGMPPVVVDAVVARTLETDDGALVLPTMPTLLGRQPNTFASWARTHANAFT
jgi:uncharacterized protein YbjT (DUF2867 family)